MAVPVGFDLTSLPRARWAGALAPSDKLSVDSANDIVRDFQQYPLTVVEFHPDATTATVSERLGAAGTSAIPSKALPAYMAAIPTDRAAIETLAADDAVAWIYPATTDLVAGGALMCEGLVSPLGLVANYATVGDGWDGLGLKTVNLSYYLLAGSRDLGPSLQAAELARALTSWSRYADVRWRPAAAANEARSVTVFWGARSHGDAFPFAPEVLAHAFFPAPAVPEPLAGDIHFNDAYTWGVGDPSRYDIFSVALHESGHSLGLGHSSNPAAVMYPIYHGIVQGPSTEDIRAIQTLYAPTVRGVLPLGWADTAIGGTIKGEAVERSGIYTVTAAGRDVWGSRDELRFVSRTLTGDGDITARVDSLKAVHPWTKVGIMIRNSADPGAAHAFMLVSGGKGLAFQRRTDAGRPDDVDRRWCRSCSPVALAVAPGHENHGLCRGDTRRLAPRRQRHLQYERAGARRARAVGSRCDGGLDSRLFERLGRARACTGACGCGSRRREVIGRMQGWRCRAVPVDSRQPTVCCDNVRVALSYFFAAGGISIFATVSVSSFIVPLTVTVWPACVFSPAKFWLAML